MNEDRSGRTRDEIAGCEVMVVDPPPLRKSNTRAARQDGDSAFKALKARLLEAKR
jgi:hypothetical protein